VDERKNLPDHEALNTNPEGIAQARFTEKKLLNQGPRLCRRILTPYASERWRLPQAWDRAKFGGLSFVPGGQDTLRHVRSLPSIMRSTVGRGLSEKEMMMKALCGVLFLIVSALISTSALALTGIGGIAGSVIKRASDIAKAVKTGDLKRAEAIAAELGYRLEVA
jgi:hypothetical protein